MEGVVVKWCRSCGRVGVGRGEGCGEGWVTGEVGLGGLRAGCGAGVVGGGGIVVGFPGGLPHTGRVCFVGVGGVGGGPWVEGGRGRTERVGVVPLGNRGWGACSV